MNFRFCCESDPLLRRSERTEVMGMALSFSFGCVTVHLSAADYVNEAETDYRLCLRSFPPAWAWTPERGLNGAPPRPWAATLYQEEGTYG